MELMVTGWAWLGWLGHPGRGQGPFLLGRATVGLEVSGRGRSLQVVGSPGNIAGSSLQAILSLMGIGHPGSGLGPIRVGSRVLHLFFRLIAIQLAVVTNGRVQGVSGVQWFK